VTVVAAAVTVVAGAGLALWARTGTAGDAVVRGGARTHAHLAHPGGTPAGSGAESARSGPGADAAARAGVVNGRRQPPRVRVPWSASGRYLVVPGSAQAPPGPGRVVRYAVEVERGLPFAAGSFAAQVHRVLNDPRGWGRGGALRFARVSRGPVRFRVALSSPAMTERMCLPLRTDGLLSCHSHGRSVINARRWGQGARPYGADLAAYREYLINHEVGHALGHGHRYCPGRGMRAPVMVQQTKSLYGCRPNPWPFPHH